MKISTKMLFSGVVAVSFSVPVSGMDNNCVIVNRNNACVIEYGKKYTITDRRGDLHSFNNCKSKHQAGGKVIIYRCSSLYNSDVVPHLKGKTLHAEFEHSKTDGTKRLVSGKFVE